MDTMETQSWDQGNSVGRVPALDIQVLGTITAFRARLTETQIRSFACVLLATQVRYAGNSHLTTSCLVTVQS